MSLAPDPGREPPVDPDLVGLRPALEEALGRQDHLHLARADPEGERPERAVGGRVRVAADDRHPGLGEAQLRTDDVDDPLVRRAQAVERDAELAAVVGQHLDLGGGHRVGDRQRAVVGRDGVIGGGHRPTRMTDPQPAGPQPGERLGAGDLVDEVEVDGQDGRGARLVDDDVVVPDLLDEGARAGSADGGRVGHGSFCGRGSGRTGSVAEPRPDRPRARRHPRSPVRPGAVGVVAESTKAGRLPAHRPGQRPVRTLRGPPWVCSTAGITAASPSSPRRTAAGSTCRWTMPVRPT